MGQSTNDRMYLGMCIWHPTQIFQGRMISSPTWQRRELEPGTEVIKCTPLSSMITSFVKLKLHLINKGSEELSSY